MLQRSSKPQHESEQCDFRVFECPYRFIDNCVDWVGHRDKVLSHLLTSHSDNFKKEHGFIEPINGDEGTFVPFVNVIDYSSDNSTTSWMWTCVQMFDNKNFIINLYYVHNGSCNVHFLTMRMVDTVENSKHYRYSAMLEGPNGQLNYEGRCHSLHEEVREIYENRDCLTFDAATALKFHNKVTRDGHRKRVLNFRVKVFTS